MSDVMRGKRECGVQGVDISEGRRGQVYSNMKRPQCRPIVVSKELNYCKTRTLSEFQVVI